MRASWVASISVFVGGCILANPDFDGPQASGSGSASEGSESTPTLGSESASSETMVTSATSVVTSESSSAGTLTTSPTITATDTVTTQPTAGTESTEGTEGTEGTDGTDGTEGTDSTTDGGIPCPGPSLSWLLRFHGPGSQRIKGVAVSNTGDVGVVGTYNGTLQIDDRADGISQPSNGDDVFVARFTQSGEMQWFKVFVGAGAQRGEAIAFDSLGAMIFSVGNSGTVNFGGGNKIAMGSTDAVIVKLNAAGDHIASWGYSSPGEAQVLDLLVGANDDIVVGGAFSVSLTTEPFKPLYLGGAQVSGFVSRIKANGEAKWMQLLTGPATSRVYALDLSSNKVVLAGAYSGGSLNLDGIVMMNAGGQDAFAARLDGDTSSALWAGRSGDDLDQETRQVAYNGGSDMLFAGSFRGELGSLMNPSMGTNAYLLRFAGQEEQWALSVGTGLALESRALAVAPAGRSVWGGDLLGEAELGECALSSPNPGFFLAAVSPQGEVDWATAYSGGSAAGIEDLAFPTDGAFAAAGWYQGSFAIAGQNLPAPVDAAEDSFLVRLDPGP